MSCTANNKTVASNLIRDGWAITLQRPLADTVYIQPNTKLDTEKPHVVKCDPLAHPLDLSFEVDPDPAPTSTAQCEYKTIEGDVPIDGTNNHQF